MRAILLVFAALSNALTVMQRLASTPRFSTFYALTLAHNLTASFPQLLATSNVAIFAPTNAAFQVFYNISLPRDPMYTKHMLSYYILTKAFKPTVPGVFILESMLTQRGTGLNNLGNGKGQNVVMRVTQHKTNLEVIVNHEFRLTKSLAADNGIIYSLDSVLIPPRSLEELVQTLGLETFYLHLQGTSCLEYIQRLSNITIFAPNDAAFMTGDYLPVGIGLNRFWKYFVQHSLVFSSDIGTHNLNAYWGGNTSVVFNGNSSTVSGTRLNREAITMNSTDYLMDTGVLHVMNGLLYSKDNPYNDPSASLAHSFGTYTTLSFLVFFLLL